MVTNKGSEMMGLLDKASDVGSTPAKKPAKAVPKAKAIPKAKAVATATPVQTPKAAKVAKTKAKKEPKVRPQGLPENFEIASPNARRIAWFTNFVINLGPIFAFLFSVTILDAFTTIFALVALAALVMNLIVVPIMSGRTLGNFVSRTKNVNSSGDKPNFLHALLVNSTGIFALTGFIFLMVNVQSVFNTNGSEQIWASVWSVLGIIFIVLYFVNSSFKRSSDMHQGLYDSLFGAYLVKHVPEAGEESSGFIARLESMGSYGDRYSKRQAEKKVKRAEKEKAAEAEKASQSEEESSDKSESEGSDSSAKDEEATE